MSELNQPLLEANQELDAMSREVAELASSGETVAEPGLVDRYRNILERLEQEAGLSFWPFEPQSDRSGTLADQVLAAGRYLIKDLHASIKHLEYVMSDVVAREESHEEVLSRRLLDQERSQVLRTLVDAWRAVPNRERQSFVVRFSGEVRWPRGITDGPVELAHPGLDGGSVEPDWRHIRRLARDGLLKFDWRTSKALNPTPNGFDAVDGGQPELETDPADDSEPPIQPHRTGQWFIVHGRDDATKWATKNYFQNSLGLPEPMILHEIPSRGRTIIEKFEEVAASADGAVVLLTPDDTYVNDGGDSDHLRRARQNVILELGYFLGLKGRRSGKVLLLYKRPLDIPSDLGGVVYIDITDGIESAGEQIRRELGL